MELNWTTEILISFIAMGITSVAVIILIGCYARTRERYVLWLTLFSLSYLAHILLITLSDILLSLPLMPLAYLPMYLAAYGLIFATDAISREKIEPFKVSIWTGFIVILILVSFQPNSFSHVFFPNGEKSMVMSGIYEMIALTGLFFVVFPFSYYMIKIHKRAPQSTKKYSILLLIGSIFLLGTGGFEALHLPYLIPGINFITITIGTLFITIVFARNPTLGFLLPFQVLRLLIYETNGGLTLFSRDWDREGKMVSQPVFAGSMQGIGIILGQWVNQGNVQEIDMARAVLLLHQSVNYPVACVLVATKASPFLRASLDGFAKEFYAQFGDKIRDSRGKIPFQLAEPLVRKWFAFVPVY